MKKPMLFYFQMRLLLLSLLIIVIPVFSNAQPLITMHFDNIKSWDPYGPWGFDADAPGFNTHDQNYFTFCTTLGYLYHNYAYQYFGPAVETTSSCLTENLAFVANVADITLVFQTYNLSGYDKYNTVNPGAAWNIAGQAGDRRTYSNGSCIIYQSGVPKLYVNNLTFDVKTPYPTQAQMRATSPLFVNWVGNVGSGAAITADGWGEIDMALSDPQWAAAFDNGNGQTEMHMSSVSYVLQGAVGWYSFDLDVLPAPVQHINAPAVVPLGQPLNQIVNFPAQKVNLVFAPNVVGGGANANMNVLNIKKILTPPLAKAFPPGIVSTVPFYWDITSTLGTFACDMTFDLTGVNFGYSADWRVLKRDHGDWEIYPDYLRIDANHIKALGVTDFSEWTIGSTEETLPVEMASFTAIVNTENLAVLNWVTHSETELAGYRIYRNTIDNQNQAQCLNVMPIPAMNNSIGANYSYTDEDLSGTGTYYYWLEVLNLTGSTQLFGPVLVTIEDSGGTPIVVENTELLDAYPNPFSQTSIIHYNVKEQAVVKLEIFNSKGQLVHKSVNNHPEAGHYKMTWNAAQLPEGIYFYRMIMGEYSSTKKIILMK